MIRLFLAVFLICFPLSLYAQNSERWFESENSKRVFIASNHDSTFVTSKTRIADGLKERQVVYGHDSYTMLYDRKAKQTNWLHYNDTIATVEAAGSGKNRIFTFADGSVFKLEKEKRREWVISQDGKPLLSIKREREKGKNMYLLIPQDEHEKLEALRPLALTYLVEFRKLQERQTISMVLAGLAGVLRSFAF